MTIFAASGISLATPKKSVRSDTGQFSILLALELTLGQSFANEPVAAKGGRCETLRIAALDKAISNLPSRCLKVQRQLPAQNFVTTGAQFGYGPNLPSQHRETKGK